LEEGNHYFFRTVCPRRVEENKNSHNQLQEILNKTNKNDSILFSGDLNARKGNAEICNVVGSLGEPVQIQMDWN
jgi:hypothetical protein